MHIADIKFLYDYNYWATQLILKTASNLSSEQLIQPTSFSWGSLFATLVHTMDAENMWRNLCQHNHLLDKRITQTDSFTTLDAVINFCRTEETAMRDYINSLQDTDLTNIVSYDLPEGKRERVLWHCLVHVVNHGTQHRSECAAMLTDFGYSPGNIDMTRYLNMLNQIEN